MYAVTYMRYIYENRNYVTKKRLHYYLDPDMKFLIKERLSNIISMKEDESELDDNIQRVMK